MRLSEIVSADSKLFAKSEFGPASDHWPALSFSSHKIAADFANVYHRGRDFVVYVGTGDPQKTERAEHRQNLLSVLSVEPRAPISTKDLVPSAVWERSVLRWGERWDWSLPIATTYDIVGFPSAHDTIPRTYRSLGNLSNLGRCVSVQESEYKILLGLEIQKISLNLSKRAREVLNLNTDDRKLRQEISRLVDGIKHDIAMAGTPRLGVNPLRLMPNDSDLFLTLIQRWNEQGGKCALCDRPIPLKPENKLLQISRDRTDSGNKAYDWQNTRLTHLACNLGKSDATHDEWQDYLALIRQV
jgi:hypothetical protein